MTSRLLLAALVIAAALVAKAGAPATTPPVGAPPPNKQIPGVPDDYFTRAGDLSTPVGRLQATARGEMLAVMQKERSERLSPEFLELKLGVARHICDADLEAAKTKDERLAARRIYLAIVEQHRQCIWDRREIDADALSIAACEHRVAEAQYLLEKERK